MAKDARLYRKLLLQALIELHGPGCCRCGKPVDLALPSVHPQGPTLDHLTPFRDGGTDELANFGVAHFECNRSHGIRMAVRWSVSRHHHPNRTPGPGQAMLW